MIKSRFSLFKIANDNELNQKIVDELLSSGNETKQTISACSGLASICSVLPIDTAKTNQSLSGLIINVVIHILLTALLNKYMCVCFLVLTRTESIKVIIRLLDDVTELFWKLNKKPALVTEANMEWI